MRRGGDLEVRWAEAADLPRLFGVASVADFFERAYPRWRIRIGERNGRVIGGGGVAWGVAGDCLAFCQPAPRRYALTLHKEATRVLAEAKAAEDVIVAVRQLVPTSERWLAHHGFRPITEDGEVWEWRR